MRHSNPSEINVGGSTTSSPAVTACWVCAEALELTPSAATPAARIHPLRVPIIPSSVAAIACQAARIRCGAGADQAEGDAMKLIITGGSGQLARRAAELALATIAPQDLILTTRTPAALRSFAERAVLVRQADFAATPTRGAAFAGGEKMLLVSGTDLGLRTGQHQAAIDAAKAAGVRHVVYTSGLRPEPPNPAVVATSHYATEQALARSGMEWTILPHSLYADYQIPEADRAIAAGALVHNRGTGKV